MIMEIYKSLDYASVTDYTEELNRFHNIGYRVVAANCYYHADREERRYFALMVYNQPNEKNDLCIPILKID